MRFRSVRSRVIIGSLLWAVGLYVIAHLAALYFVTHHPIRIAHNTLLAIAALVCIIAGLLGVRSGLSPLRMLRERLEDVRAGRSARIEGDHPTEVQPLVSELNELLDDREQRVARALSRAGDLAHGLKTPLAVLRQAAVRARADGHLDLAEILEVETERMYTIVERHLAHARASASGRNPSAICSVALAADAIVRTMKILHADKSLTFDIRVEERDMFPGEAIDLEEMLGNLLDNACKWAHSRVVLSSELRGDRLTIIVDDDGDGLTASQMAEVTRRGQRADEKMPGSGLGLAITSDLAEIYGGMLTLDRSPEGGVRVTLDLPARADAEARA